MKHTISIGDKYGPAMQITTQEEADAYFEECVRHTMSFGRTRQEAEDIERQNLGYYAGYYDAKTRERVERLFRCSHPVFGSIAEKGKPTPEEAFAAGTAMGRAAIEDAEKEREHVKPARLVIRLNKALTAAMPVSVKCYFCNQWRRWHTSRFLHFFDLSICYWFGSLDLSVCLAGFYFGLSISKAKEKTS